MNKEGLIWIGMSMGLILGFWKAIDFRTSHESSFNTKVGELELLSRRLKSLKADQIFILDHQSKLDFLFEKKWFSPENRLIAGEKVEKVGATLVNLNYTFEPEGVKTLENGYRFRVTKIIINIDAILDTDIYTFIDNMLGEFPGILQAYEMILTLNKEDPPPYLKGHLVFEWISMGDKE